MRITRQMLKDYVRQNSTEEYTTISPRLQSFLNEKNGKALYYGQYKEFLYRKNYFGVYYKNKDLCTGLWLVHSDKQKFENFIQHYSKRKQFNKELKDMIK